jgi:hypothetical protein
MLGFLHVLVDYAGHCSNRRFAEAPRVCPSCGHHMDPWRLAAHSTSPSNVEVDFAFQCPRADCRRTFVAHYVLGADAEFDLADVYRHLGSGDPVAGRAPLTLVRVR